MEAERAFVKTCSDSQFSDEERASATHPLRAWMRHRAFVISAYVLLTVVTVPFFMGDTIGYSGYIVNRDFSDFGHFGWYLIGYPVSELLMPLTTLIVGPSHQLNVTFTLVLINWIVGFVSVIVMHSLVFHVTKKQGAANLATLALMLSQSFLNFTQSGCSYIPGMAFLLLGIWILVKNGESGNRHLRASILAGLALAASVSVWFTYVFSIPAALITPAVLYGFNKQRFILAIKTGLVISAIVVVTFGAGAYALGIRSVEGVKEWVMQSSHGVRGMSGIPRTLFGMGRSFIDMGNDGPMMKAYFAKDPYNPVSLGDLARTSLWKLALFYLFVCAVLFNLLRSKEGKRIFTLLAINAAPVLGFAILWQGGAIERYLLLFPVFFVAFGYTIASIRSVSALKYASIAFVALMAFANLRLMAKPVQDAREEAVVSRIKELETRLKPESVVAMVTQLDEVWAFEWTFPFNPINAAGKLDTYHIIEPATHRALMWRELFAEEIITAWNRGGDAWVSRRIESPRPLREWKWIEGDDPAVTWKSLNEFFAQLELGEAVGGDDGFVMLLPSEQNRALLTKVAQQKNGNAGQLASNEAQPSTNY